MYCKKSTCGIEKNAAGVDSLPKIVLASIDHYSKIDEYANDIISLKLIEIEDKWISDEDNCIDCYKNLPLHFSRRTWASLCNSDNKDIKPNKVHCAIEDYSSYNTNDSDNTNTQVSSTSLENNNKLSAAGNTSCLKQCSSHSESTKSNILPSLQDWDNWTIKSYDRNIG